MEKLALEYLKRCYLGDIYLSQDRQQLILSCDINDDEYSLFIFRTTSECCCSSTWIESISGIELENAQINYLESIDLNKEPDNLENNNDDDKVTQYYGLRINTNKGTIDIDYRNESNGYYGGQLEFVARLFKWKDIFVISDALRSYKKFGDKI